jgi:hypothetical protein
MGLIQSKEFWYLYFYYVSGALSYFLVLSFIISISTYILIKLKFTYKQYLIVNLLLCTAYLPLDTLWIVKLLWRIL